MNGSGTARKLSKGSYKITHGYLEEKVFEDAGVKLLFANYQPLEYGSLPNASMFDYLMHCGAVVPDLWKARKEQMHHA